VLAFSLRLPLLLLGSTQQTTGGCISTIADELGQAMKAMEEQTFRRNNPADYIHKRLSSLIASFQNGLCDDVEVGH